MKRIADWIRENSFILIIGILTVAYMASPLGNTRLHNGHDFSYHLLRIENIKDGLLNGQIPVRIGPLFLNHRGYGSSLFYPELFLYIPALFRLAGLTIETSYKLFALLTIVGCFVTTYLCAKGISKDKYTALITAVIFSACQYHIANLYVRGAVGEAQAFVFFPLVVYGIYDLIYRDFQKAWVMGLGFWGLMFSHSISLAIALCTTAGICLFHFKTVVLNGRKFVKLLLTAAVTLLCSIGFWLPMIEQLLSNSFWFSQPWTTVTDNAVGLVQLFGTGYYDYTYNFDTGVLLMCLTVLLLPGEEKKSGGRKKIYWFLGIGFALLYVASRYFPWPLLQPVLNSIQFPWRFYAIATLFLAIAIGLAVQEKWRGRFGKEAVLAVLCVMVLFGNRYFENANIDYVKIEENAFTEKDCWYSFQIVQKEWLPKKTDLSLFESEPDRPVLTDRRVSLPYTEEKKMGIVFDYGYGKGYCDVPLVWYKGYTAHYMDGGRVVPLTVTDEGYNGYIRVYFDESMTGGTVLVEYSGTRIQKASLAVNLLAAAAVAGVWLLRKKRRGTETAGDRQKGTKHD